MNKSFKYPFSRIPAWSYYIILVGIIYLSAGCANITSVNHLHQAQKAFNNAAEIENKSRFVPDELIGKDKVNLVMELSAARSEYAAALVILQQMPDEEKQMLVNDKLWGVKLTLEGLTLWRLGKYEEVVKIIDRAEKESKDQIYPRDAALLTALPGLIKIDLAYQEILEVKGEDNTQKKKVLDDLTKRLVEMDGTKKRVEWSAVQHLNEARGKVNKAHSVNSYLIQSQLAAYRNYKVAYTLISDEDHKSVSADSKYKEEAEYNLHDLKALITKLKDSVTSDKLVDQWSIRCNIRPEIRPELQ